MLTGVAMAAAADSLQAQHLRQCLSEERVELAAKLAKHAKILTESMTSREMRSISHHRGRIR